MRHLIAFGALLGLLWPTAVLAGPVESPAEITISPNDPNLWVIRYEYAGGGFLFSEDAGTTWRLICNSAVDPGITRDTTGVAVAASGKVYTGVFTGMWEIGAGGCGSSMVAPFEGQWVSDVINDPDDPKKLYAITSTGAKMNGIFTYDGDAETWSETGSREMLLIGRLRVTKTDSGMRFYQSIVDGEVEVPNAETGFSDYYPNYFIRYSDDGGATWTANPGFEMTDARVRLEAIDPTNPDRIVVSETFGADSDLKDIIWVSDQAGATGSFKKLAEVDTFGGLTFAPDGRMWFSDSRSTVQYVPVGAKASTPVGEDIRARCLAYDPTSDTVIACRLTDVVAIAEDGSLTTKLDFRFHDGWVECKGDGPTVASMCEMQMASAAWCGVSHYPNAGICAAYCYPGLNDSKVGVPGECGDIITPDAPGTGDGDMSTGDGDMSTGDGDTPATGDGDAPGTGDGDASGGDGDSAPDAGMEPAAAKKADDDGCSVTHGRHGWLGLIPMLAALGWVRRRRTARR